MGCMQHSRPHAEPDRKVSVSVSAKSHPKPPPVPPPNKPPLPNIKIPRTSSTHSIPPRPGHGIHPSQGSLSLAIPRKTSNGTPRHSLHGSTPPSVESFLAKRNNKRRKLPSLPKFGAPLNQQVLRELNQNDYSMDSIVIKDDYGQIPSILILLKKYLLRFHGYQYIGIFANGSVSNINKYHLDDDDGVNIPFVTGYVSKVDVFGMKSLIEADKIDTFSFDSSQEMHYAMVFAELIKLWLQYLAQRLLHFLPASFFEDVTSIQILRMQIDKIPEPQLSTFLFLLDIMVEATNNSTVNKMTIKRMAAVFGPFLFKHKDKKKNEKLKSVLTRFCEIAIRWRKSRYH